MKIPQLARYNGTVLKTYDFVMSNITEFPIDLFAILKKFNWKIITYDELAQKSNYTVKDIEECFGRDAYSLYNCQKGTYKIAYNTNGNSTQRINFSIAHEIGHIVLGHLRDFEHTSTKNHNISDAEYKILENEANCFARNLLAPAPLIQKTPFLFKFFRFTDIFGISSSAKKTRMSFLKNDLNYLTTTQIHDMQQRFDIYLECNHCNYRRINKNAKYCPMCGKTKLKKGNGFMIYINSIETDETKKVKICPRCCNEEILDGDYCPICGLYLFNKCTNCEESGFGNVLFECNNICNSNARYCEKCGSKTLFFQNGLLTSYEKYMQPVDNSIKKLWTENINNLKQNGKIVLYTNLINSELIELDSVNVAINFPNGITPFCKTVINKEENLSTLRTMVNRTFNSTKTLKIYSNYEELFNNDNIYENKMTNTDDLPF